VTVRDELGGTIFIVGTRIQGKKLQRMPLMSISTNTEEERCSRCGNHIRLEHHIIMGLGQEISPIFFCNKFCRDVWVEDQSVIFENVGI